MSALAAGPEYARRSRVLLGRLDTDTERGAGMDTSDPEGPEPTDYWRDEVVRRMDTVSFTPPARDPHRRMSTAAAGRVAYRLLSSPEGTSPAEVQRATGRSARWAAEWLRGAVETGRAERTGHGPYRLREPEPAAHGS